MNIDTLNRRQFLRLSFVSATAAIVAACKRNEPETDASTPAADAAPHSDLEGEGVTASASDFAGGCEVRLDTVDADVWAWETPLGGQVVGAEECLAVMLMRNGVEIDVSQEAENFRAHVPIAEGKNEVVATCRCGSGQEGIPDTVTFTARLAQRPKAIIAPALDGDRLLLDGAMSQPDERHNAPIVEYVWTARPGNPGPVQRSDGSEFDGDQHGERITLTVPPIAGEYYFTLRVVDEAGREDSSTTYVEVRDGALRIPDYDAENPAWVDEAIVYGVIPRNFGQPAFQAIIDRLDYLQELGINALWLAPVNVSPAGDYGYAVVDYFKLNPRYGTEEDFRRLVQEAHARGVRVLMDLVPNHSSSEHPYFQDTINNGKQSHHWDFYERDENDTFTHYFNWEHLPNLNYENPEVRRWMLEASSYWIREFDIDGYRVDVAWGVRERRPQFWMEWRRELKRIKPDLLLLAEASARDPFYFDHGFDAAYDWTEELGHWAWGLVWDSYQHTLLIYNLKNALTDSSQGYHPDALIFRFLNNNDTGHRFISHHGEGMTRVATAMLLTLPGIPCIYTADEVGEFFSPYFDAMPLSWEEKFLGLREYHQKLIALRKEVASLHSRHWQILEAEPHKEVFGYLRYGEDNAQPVLVLLNFFEPEVEVEVHLPDDFRAQFSGESWLDLLADDTISLSDTDPVRVPLGGFGARILAPVDWRNENR